MKFLKKKRVWVGLALIAVIVLIRVSGLSSYISLEQLKMQREWLELMVANHYAYAVVSYIAIYMAVVALSLPIGAILTTAGGFLFGTVLGTLFANIGATTGAIMVFSFVRYVAGTSLQRMYAHKLAEFNGALAREGASYLLFVRLIVIVPFFVVNILAGLTQVPLWTFVWTTSLGIIPASLVFAFAGEQLMDIDSMRDVFSWDVILAFVLLACVALLPIVVKKLRKK